MTRQKELKLTKRHARKVLKIVDAGLVHGLGKPVQAWIGRGGSIM